MGTPIEIPGQPPPPEPVGDVGDGAGEGDGGSAFGTPQLPAGPIRGVRSLSDEEGYRTFFEKTRYRDWEFSLELLTSPQMTFQIGIGGIPRCGSRRADRPAVPLSAAGRAAGDAGGTASHRGRRDAAASSGQTGWRSGTAAGRGQQPPPETW